MKRSIARIRQAYDDGTYPRDFWEWLHDNWHVYDKFVALARQAKDAGYSKWSARSIVHVMRWQTAIVERSRSGLKINDHASPGLARLAMGMEEDLSDFFEVRGHNNQIPLRDDD